MGATWGISGDVYLMCILCNRQLPLLKVIWGLLQ
jgi:hypothetical protein